MTLKSAVFIIPAAYQAAGNALAESMGWGLGTYSVALSPTGEAPATHYCCRADVTEGFLAMLADPPPEAAEVLAVVQIDVSEDMMGADHWPMVLEAEGLKVVNEGQT